MLAGSETIATSVDHWLGQFERALTEPDDVLLKTLFHPDSHWRDVLALTWHIRTVNGLDTILRELNAHVGRAHPTGFRTDPHRTAPRYVTRAGTKALEAIFRFETAEGRGSGVVRLTPDANDGDTLRAWTLLTALDEIKGFAEQVGRSRPSGKSYSRDFRGPNWLDLRKAAAEYIERDPAVLVVGGGQAGLSTAARLAATPSVRRSSAGSASNAFSLVVKAFTSPVEKLASSRCCGGYSASSPSAISDRPEWRATSGGEPAAPASAATMPNASGKIDGTTVTSASGRRCARCRCSSGPVNSVRGGAIRSSSSR